MNQTEMVDKVLIILEKEKYNIDNGKRDKQYFYDGPITTSQRSYGGRASEPLSQQFITNSIYVTYDSETVSVIKLDHIKWKYETLSSLLKLYEHLQINTELQDYFIEYLRLKIGQKDISGLCMETLLKLGHFDSVKKTLSEFHSERSNGLIYCIRVLDELLFFEYNLFDMNELNDLKMIINNWYLNEKNVKGQSELTLWPVKKILDRIMHIQYEETRSSLGVSSNFQINLDKKKVKDNITKFGFDIVLSEALDKIDEYYFNKAKDEFEYSFAISLLREYFEKLIKLIAERIKEISGEEYPTTRPTLMGNMRLYIDDKLNLGKDDILLDYLIEKINKKGSHAFKAEREYFRLTYNISIEISLLLFIKLDKFPE